MSTSKSEPESDRDALVRQAESEMRVYLSEWAKKHGLTRAEEARFLADYLASRLSAAVAKERSNS